MSEAITSLMTLSWQWGSQMPDKKATVSFRWSQQNLVFGLQYIFLSHDQAINFQLSSTENSHKYFDYSINTDLKSRSTLSPSLHKLQYIMKNSVSKDLKRYNNHSQIQCDIKLSEAVARRCSVKKVSLKIAQNAQGNAFAGATFQ